MTLDYTKMFLIVTEEAVVKGHFTLLRFLARKGAFLFHSIGFVRRIAAAQLLHGARQCVA